MDGADLVKRHFDLIDSGEMHAMAELFEPHAVYLRPGYPAFTGRDEILHFYTRLRPILDGRHALEEVLGSGPSLAVQGGFAGRRLDGSPIELRFSDFFELGSNGRFIRRETYFSAPLSLLGDTHDG